MTVNIPGYTPGTYDIDPVHSSLTFSVRHMMVAKVKGIFEGLSGTIVLGETPEASSINAEVDPATVDTRNPDRDAHLRSSDFFATEEHPKWTFTSTATKQEGDEFIVEGELQLRGTSRPVTLAVEFGGIGEDTYGQTRAGASAKFRINRYDFGISFNQTLEKGGVMLSDDVNVELEISAVKQA